LPTFATATGGDITGRRRHAVHAAGAELLVRTVEALAVTLIRITLHDRHEKTPVPSNKPLEPENRTSRPKEKCMAFSKCLEGLGKKNQQRLRHRTRAACPLGRGALPVRQTVPPQRLDAPELGGERAGSVTEAVLAALVAGTGLVLRTADAWDRTLLRVVLHDSDARSLYPVISRSEAQM
jgi:hypothetical protein